MAGANVSSPEKTVKMASIFVEGVHRLDTSLKLDFWQVFKGDLVVFNHITGEFFIIIMI